MSAELSAAINKGQVNQAIFADIGHPSGDAHFWSGYGLFEYAGKTYTGAGKLGKIETVAESLEAEIIEVRFTLTGVDADLIAGLSQSVKGRDTFIYEAVLDANWRVIDWELLMQARLDFQNYTLGEDGTATIVIAAHGGLFFLTNRTAAKYSPEDMKVRFPNETGFDEVHRVEDQTLNWAAA